MQSTFYIILTLTLLACVALIVFAVVLSNRNKKLTKENITLKKEKGENLNAVNSSEFEHTKFILNQHLFKNTLNSIQGYAYRTHMALEKLGGVLDYVLYDSGSQLISLKQELEFAKNFIELNKIKLLPVYDIRIKENIDVNNPFYEQPVIVPLITAYFIENTFKHADLQSNDAFISIEIELKDDHFLFIVTNKVNKKPLLSAKSGIGKENLKRRLDLIYKTHYKLEYIADNGIYTSYLKINLLEFKNKMHNIG
ncbi:MAG TPA: histidine kinase [Bacteroidia bacterium]|jgi:LytS/YehU family sensor histidine kinase|nr:histidine kinase [Bacteroidia bacterium]